MATTPDGPPRELFLMIRSLLEERFKLKTHHETRELPTYELVVARADGKLGPGLHKSDVDCDAVFAARRAGVPPPSPRGPMDPPPCRLMGGPARIISGGTTMEQLATNLALRVERRVIDRTGLSGRFEFNLAFTPDRLPDGAPPPGVPADRSRWPGDLHGDPGAAWPQARAGQNTGRRRRHRQRRASDSGLGAALMDSHIRDVSETQPYASRGSFAIIEQPTGPRPTANPLPRRP